jgi:hypothetical protein
VHQTVRIIKAIVSTSGIVQPHLLVLQVMPGDALEIWVAF